MTPFFKRKIAAGRHEVILKNAGDGAIVKRTVVVIAAGQTVTVSAP